jgi:hypothetical protein
LDRFGRRANHLFVIPLATRARTSSATRAPTMAPVLMASAVPAVAVGHPVQRRYRQRRQSVASVSTMTPVR